MARNGSSPSLVASDPAAMRPTSSSIRAAIVAAGRTSDTPPVAMALRGMSAKAASAGSCVIVIPPALRTATVPAAPSSSVPDSSTDTTRGPCACAAVRSSGSMAGRDPFSRAPTESRSRPSSTRRWLPGGATDTVPGSSGVPSSANRERRRPPRPSRVGSSEDECSGMWITTQTAAGRPPGSARTIVTSGISAPADPPITTSGTRSPRDSTGLEWIPVGSAGRTTGARRLQACDGGPVTEERAERQPGREQRAGEQPHEVEPRKDQAAEDRAGEDEPADDEPADDQTADDEPADDEPADEPGEDESVDDR